MSTLFKTKQECKLLKKLPLRYQDQITYKMHENRIDIITCHSLRTCAILIQLDNSDLEYYSGAEKTIGCLSYPALNRTRTNSYISNHATLEPVFNVEYQTEIKVPLSEFTDSLAKAGGSTILKTKKGKLQVLSSYISADVISEYKGDMTHAKFFEYEFDNILLLTVLMEIEAKFITLKIADQRPLRIDIDLFSNSKIIILQSPRGYQSEYHAAVNELKDNKDMIERLVKKNEKLQREIEKIEKEFEED